MKILDRFLNLIDMKDDDDFDDDDDDEACERLEVENSCEKKFDPFKKIYGSSFACVDVLEQLEEDCGMVGTPNAFICCNDEIWIFIWAILTFWKTYNFTIFIFIKFGI